MSCSESPVLRVSHWFEKREGASHLFGNELAATALFILYPLVQLPVISGKGRSIRKAHLGFA